MLQMPLFSAELVLLEQFLLKLKLQLCIKRLSALEVASAIDRTKVIISSRLVRMQKVFSYPLGLVSR